jgi:hypothetical protein
VVRQPDLGLDAAENALDAQRIPGSRPKEEIRGLPDARRVAPREGRLRITQQGVDLLAGRGRPSARQFEERRGFLDRAGAGGTT